jgi:pantetheine-phosphate adenylyltransferase
MAQEVETVFLAASADHLFLGSNIIKEIAGYGGCIDKMVPEHIKGELLKKLQGEG